MISLSRETILNEQFLIDILKYLNLEELAALTGTAKVFYNVVNRENNIIFDSLKIVSIKNENNLKFLLNIVKNNQLNSLNLLLCENVEQSRLILSSVNPNSVHQLKIPLKIFKTANDITRFCNLKKLSIKNMWFNEAGAEEDILMVQNLLQMPWIQELKITNAKYLKASFLQYLNNKFYKLDFRESADIIVEDMFNTLIKQAESLRIFRIDGENSSETSLKDILRRMVNLKEIFIGYCENFYDNLLKEFVQLTKKIEKLSLRKMKNITSTALHNLLEQSDLTNLIKLDFYHCPSFDSLSLKIISLKAYNLEYLEISWSNNVENDAVIEVFKNCKKLRYFYLQGCKFVTDKVFNEFLNIDDKNKNIKSALDELKLVDFTSCNYIEDSVLFKVLKIYPQLTFLNYYGNSLKADL